MKRELLSTNEVAELLGISPFTIRRYIQLRKLKALKLEGSYRVRRTDLNQFLKAREIETEEELAGMAEQASEKGASARRTALPTQAARSPAKPKNAPKRARTRTEQGKKTRKIATRDRKER